MVSWYFAYGSNMNPGRVRERGLNVVDVQAASINDLSLRFDKAAREHPGEGHANLVWLRGSTAEGVLYRLVAPVEIEKMDPFETAPRYYSREVITVQTGQGPVQAWTYFANAAVRRDGLLPSRDYLDHLLAGQPWLSPKYFDWLAAHPVAPRRQAEAGL